MSVAPLQPPATPADVGSVLHVIERRTAIGFTPLIAEVIRLLAERGVRTAVLANDEELVLRLPELSGSIHLVRDLSGWRAWRMWQYLRRHFTPPPEIVHLWGTRGLGWLRQWTRSSGAALIVHALNRGHHRRLESLKCGEREVFASSQLSGEFGAAVHPGLEDLPAAFVPLGGLAARPRESGVCSLLVVAPFAQSGGYEALLDAVARLAQTGDRLQVAALGAGAGIEAVWRRVRERALGRCVSLLDAPRLWERVLPEVDLLVVPAEERRFSLVSLTAMGLGKPVIAAREQRSPWFHEDRTCWMFSPGSGVELAYLLERALVKPAQAAELAEAARDYARTHHTLGVLLPRLLSLYARVSGRTAPDAAERMPVS